MSAAKTFPAETSEHLGKGKVLMTDQGLPQAVENCGGKRKRAPWGLELLVLAAQIGPLPSAAPSPPGT